MANTPGRKSPFKSRTKVSSGREPDPELLQQYDQLMQQLITDPVFKLADEQFEEFLEYFENNFPVNDEPEENVYSGNSDVFASPKNDIIDDESWSCVDNIVVNEEQNLVSQPKLISALQCTVCWKVLKSRQGLRVHRKSHGVAPYFCGIDGCLEAFDERINLDNHEHLQHCTCKICGQTLGNRTGLKLHEQGMHSSSKTETISSNPKPVEKKSSQPTEPDAANLASFQIILSSSMEIPAQDTNLSLAISAVALAYFNSYGTKKITLQNLDAVVSNGRLHLKICTAKCASVAELTRKDFGESICSDKPLLKARLLFEGEHERKGNLTGKSSAEILQTFFNQHKLSLLSVLGMNFVFTSASDHPGFYLLDPNRVTDNSNSTNLDFDCKKARLIKFSKAGIPELMSYLRALGGHNADRMNFSIVPVEVL